MRTDVVILAAGQGTRMYSSQPKVLHKLAGRSMVSHVITAARTLDDAHIHLVIGHGADAVREEAAAFSVGCVEQGEQLGTGHAVQQAMPGIPAEGKVLVLYGDVPLIKPETLSRLLKKVKEDSLALLTVELEDASGYGRIVRNQQGSVTAIVEHKDADQAVLQIREINTGILAGPASFFHSMLPKLENNNAQGEYYLTDLIGMASDAGLDITTVHPANETEVQGVNNRKQLAELERAYQGEQAEKLLLDGVGLADPARIDVRGSLVTGKDCWIDINTLFVGDVKLGDNVTVGPNCMISNSTIGSNVEIKANSVLEGAEVIGDAEIGPFARLRPGTRLAKGARVGNFVETKKSEIGEGSKVNHLTYIGDSIIGKNVNVGAGTITCNYDGEKKSTTEIGDEAFIGSNSSLVAPVKIGKGSTIGAGSTITSDVPDETLSVGRGKQRNIQGWQRPTKKED